MRHVVSASLVERWLAAGDAGDVDAFDELLAADVVVHAPMGLSTVGRDAEKEVWREARRAMPDLRHEVVEVVESGHTIVARTVVSATLVGDFAGVTGTGQTFRTDQAVFAHVGEGRIIEAWEIVDTAALLRQVGAIPA